jgi:hypothetical protein
MPSGSSAPAARRRHRAKQHRGYIGWEKSGLLRVSAYILPAASRDAARRAWGNPSCYYPQAKLKLMGGGKGIDSEGHGRGRKTCIRAPAELGLGEMNACVNEGAGWCSSCRNARGRRLEPMLGTACDVQPKSIDN